MQVNFVDNFPNYYHWMRTTLYCEQNTRAAKVVFATQLCELL